MSTEQGWSAWTAIEEPGRGLDDIFNGPPTFGERQLARSEKQLAEEARQRHADMIDEAHQAVFRARATGRPIPTVEQFLAGRSRLADQQAADRPQVSRMRRARQILAGHGLDDVLPGRIGAIFDPNVGAIDVGGGRDDVSRAAAEQARQIARHEENGEWMRGYITRNRRPGGREAVRSGTAVRSHSCQHCIDAGVDDDTSYLLHSDPELAVPITPPGQARQAETAERRDGRVPMIYR